MDNLDEVYSALSDVRDKWKQIGRLLCGSLTLETIGHHHGDSLRDVLQAWLSSEVESNWETIIEILTRDDVGEENLARKLEEKYHKGKS